ncbi:MAG: EAL domain-containing protein [Actinomycetota bacterium]
MGFSPASDRGSSERRFRLGLLIALAAVGIATVAAILRGIGEMPVLSKVALGALYAGLGAVLFAAVPTFRRQRRRLSDAEAQYRSLVEKVPVVVYMDAVDDISSPQYVSPRYQELLGYTPAERLADPELWARCLHPSDGEWVLAELRRVSTTMEPWHCEYRLIAKDGSTVWVRDEATIVHDDEGHSLFWQGVLVDITPAKTAEAALLRKEAILDAAAFTADRLLRAEDWRDCVHEVLGRVGKATDASRVYIFENHSGPDGELLMSGRYEWVADGISTTIADEGNQNWPYAQGYEAWPETLGTGQVVCGLPEDFGGEQAADFAEEGILSAAIVPIFAGDEWWGYIGFDDCVAPREWSPSEIDALTVAAGALGSAIGRHRAEEARRDADVRYRALVEQIPAIVYIDVVDESMSTSYVSPQINSLLGVTPEEYIADPDCWYKHLHPEDKERALAEYLRGRDAGESFTFEYRLVSNAGSVVWFRDSAVVVRNEDGTPSFVHGVMLDITERKKAEEQVAFLAYHDKLTGLPNRAMFEELLDLAMARARRHELSVAVVYADLDNFKLVNDSLGHEAGDELLRQLADRLREATRDTDLVARQGGDEFLLLLADLERDVVGPASDPTDGAMLIAETVANRIHDSLRHPFILNGVECYASVSLGISLFPQDSADLRGVLKNADTAMYQSKTMGPGGYVLYSEDTGDPMSRLSFSTRLRKAVESRNWILHYQPVVNLTNGDMVGVEALLRWQDPNGGLIPPGEFIPLAEEMGLIEVIGDWVIEELCRQDAEWRRDGLSLEMNFNLSPRQLWQPEVVEKVMRPVEAFGADPTNLVLEITESTAMTDPERTQRLLWEFHAKGFRVALDDFGTGYSSLSRLKHLPVDILKIDRSFVRDVAADPEAGSMVRAIIQLAAGLGMTPLAEGVETEQEWRFLADHGCRLGQGYHFSRPVPASEISAQYHRSGLRLVAGGA